MAKNRKHQKRNIDWSNPEEVRKHHREYMRGKLRKKLEPKKCPFCGKEFIPYRKNQVLCGSSECKKEWQRNYEKHKSKTDYSKGTVWVFDEKTDEWIKEERDGNEE